MERWNIKHPNRLDEAEWSRETEFYTREQNRLHTEKRIEEKRSTLETDVEGLQKFVEALANGEAFATAWKTNVIPLSRGAIHYAKHLKDKEEGYSVEKYREICQNSIDYLSQALEHATENHKSAEANYHWIETITDRIATSYRYIDSKRVMDYIDEYIAIMSDETTTDAEKETKADQMNDRMAAEHSQNLMQQEGFGSWLVEILRVMEHKGLITTADGKPMEGFADDVSEARKALKGYAGEFMEICKRFGITERTISFFMGLLGMLPTIRTGLALGKKLIEATEQPEPSPKVPLDGLSVQITQRCNLACAHCYRGDARNLDMSHEIIDALLDQVESINALNIAGGEPTLATDALTYFVDGLITRNIPVGLASTTINGKQTSVAFAEQMKRLGKHVKQTGADIRRHYGADPQQPVYKIIISNDEFHDAQGVTKENRRDAERFYNARWIPARLSDRAKMENLLAAGRAKDGIKGKCMGILNRFHRIPSVTEVEGCTGLEACLEILADGSLILDGSIENDYPEKHPEGVICNVLTDSIAKAIEAWNEKYPNDRCEDDVQEYMA